MILKILPRYATRLISKALARSKKPATEITYYMIPCI